ncbi:MAG: aspartyl/asparaginyl beta-hydroxylase domain-containing protein [Gammaproteobacteria bacterium]|nr:aspartyl/asparaginyl beta-hydroxylase domain-containing protein [Gammaproteobacteria bacterium]
MDNPSVESLLQNAREAHQSGDVGKAIAIYQALLSAAPGHLQARFDLALALFQSRRIEECESHLEALTRMAPDEKAFRVRRAQVLNALGRMTQAAGQLDEAIRIDPADIVLHLNHGALCYQHVNRETALRSFQRALILAPQLSDYAADPRVPPPLRDAMKLAVQSVAQLNQQFVEETLSQTRAEFPDSDLSRLTPGIRNCGTSRNRYARKDQRPVMLYLPEVPERPWFDADRLPWLEAVQDCYEAIDSELESLLGDATPFAPYLPAQSSDTGTASDLGTLRGSMDWNAYHLYRDGQRFDEACTRCPTTASLIDQVPFPWIRHNSPEMFFSRLRPGAHITPHFGLMNVRLTVHMGLRIPEQSGIRVGTQTRRWQPGKVIAFDDSFDHEAWNRSDQERIVLIFEAWNPELNDAERVGVERFFALRRDWLDQFDDDPLLPPPGTQPRLQW